MFENALITRVGVERQVDLGLLAETIFFYQSVQLLLNGSSILGLAKQIPSDDLVSLLRRPELKLSYVHPNFGVITSGTPPVHDFGAFTFGGTKEKKAPHYTDEITMRLEDSLGKGAATRKLVNTLLDRVALHRFKESREKEKLIADLAREDIGDASFIRQAVASVLKNLVPGYTPPTNFRFEVFNTGRGYAVDTNLDFDEINKHYHRLVSPSHSSITAAYLLTHVIDARLDSHFSAYYMAEIVTTSLLSEIIRLKHFEFLKRRTINVDQIGLFHETVLPDAPTIRETINSGGRNFADFLRLLDNAEKFRGWLQNANVDTSLIRSYYLAATEKTWADCLPTKSVRFVIASGLGALADLAMPTGIGTATGLATGAADSLFLDKLIKGWRPNQFIEGPYRSFVSGALPAAPPKVA
jgi:hypothetical protein